MSDPEDHDYGDSLPVTLGTDKEVNAFIGFLGEFSTIEFDLPMSYFFVECADVSGVNEAPEVVRHCLSLFFTHINFQQYHPLENVINVDVSF